jgi:hypothetical protein
MGRMVSTIEDPQGVQSVAMPVTVASAVMAIGAIISPVTAAAALPSAAARASVAMRRFADGSPLAVGVEPVAHELTAYMILLRYRLDDSPY